jgi:hypothetical protein
LFFYNLKIRHYSVISTYIGIRPEIFGL